MNIFFGLQKTANFQQIINNMLGTKRQTDKGYIATTKRWSMPVQGLWRTVCSWDSLDELKIKRLKIKTVISMHTMLTDATLFNLLWCVSAKLVDLAYGIKKLSIICVVEDEKISVEDLREEIEQFEDVVCFLSLFLCNCVSGRIVHYILLCSCLCMEAQVLSCLTHRSFLFCTPMVCPWLYTHK